MMILSLAISPLVALIATTLFLPAGQMILPEDYFSSKEFATRTLQTLTSTPTVKAARSSAIATAEPLLLPHGS